MEAHLYIDDYIGKSWDGSGFAASDLNVFLAANKDATSITVHINSGGGSVTEGFAIYDKLKTSGKKIKTIVEGLCGSIATVIAQAGKDSGGRYMHANSDFFVHNPYWMPQAPDPMEADQLEALAEEMRKAQNKLVGFYGNITGQSIEALQNIMDRQTTLSTEEAIQWGFIDGVVEGEAIAGKRMQILAYISKPNKSTQMSDKITGMLNALIKRVFKNAMTETSEGVTIYFDGEIAVGTKIFVNPEMTEPAPDGVHTVGDKMYVVKDGVVAEEAEIESAQLEKMKKKNEELAAALEAAQTELAEVKALAASYASEFQAFKASYVAPAAPKAEPVNREPEAPKSVVERMIELRAAKNSK